MGDPELKFGETFGFAKFCQGSFLFVNVVVVSPKPGVVYVRLKVGVAHVWAKAGMVHIEHRGAGVIPGQGVGVCSLVGFLSSPEQL